MKPRSRRTVRASINGNSFASDKFSVRDAPASAKNFRREEAQRVKEEEGRGMSELVREALRLYMEDRELRSEQLPERLRSHQANQSEENGGHCDE